MRVANVNLLISGELLSHGNFPARAHPRIHLYHRMHHPPKRQNYVEYAVHPVRPGFKGGVLELRGARTQVRGQLLRTAKNPCPVLAINALLNQLHVKVLLSYHHITVGHCRSYEVEVVHIVGLPALAAVAKVRLSYL